MLDAQQAQDKYQMIKNDPNVLEMVKTLGSDVHTVTSLVMFLLVRIESDPYLKEAFKKNPTKVIRIGAKKWNEQSQRFFEELMNNPEKLKEFSEGIIKDLKGEGC